MNPGKSPSPDRLNPFCYQKYWDVVGKDVSSAVLAILWGNLIPSSLNYTNVALVSKKQNPKALNDFRPISLCNVTYKSMTKVITNR